MARASPPPTTNIFLLEAALSGYSHSNRWGDSRSVPGPVAARLFLSPKHFLPFACLPCHIRAGMFHTPSPKLALRGSRKLCFEPAWVLSFVYTVKAPVVGITWFSGTSSLPDELSEVWLDQKMLLVSGAHRAWHMLGADSRRLKVLVTGSS